MSLILILTLKYQPECHVTGKGKEGSPVLDGERFRFWIRVRDMCTKYASQLVFLFGDWLLMIKQSLTALYKRQ